MERAEILKEISELATILNGSIEERGGKNKIVYDKYVTDFLNNQLNSSAVEEWSKNFVVSEKTELKNILEYMLASSFISAWYHLSGNKAKRDKAAQSCSTLISGLRKDSESVMFKYLEFERLWRLAMKNEGITPISLRYLGQNLLTILEGLFKSFYKYYKIKKYSKKLEPSKKNLAKLINTLGEPDSDLDNFLDFCMQDTSVRLTLNHFGANRETLQELYEKLLHFGAGQWAGSYYVPVASLCFTFPLYFLLEENDIHFKDKAVLLIEYFDRNDSGPVPTQFIGPLPNDPLKPIYGLEQKLKRSKNS